MWLFIRLFERYHWAIPLYKRRNLPFEFIKKTVKIDFLLKPLRQNDFGENPIIRLR